MSEQEFPYKIGDHYFTFYENPKTGYRQVLEAFWNNDMVDVRRYNQGRIFKTYQEASQASVIKSL